jgi:hypothetical protein
MKYEYIVDVYKTKQGTRQKISDKVVPLILTQEANQKDDATLGKLLRRSMNLIDQLENDIDFTE